MIFLSHNHKDKALVEQFAYRLLEIYGQDQVFYDSWSIQPGDGIVDQMNRGIEGCELFLFFVSTNSLQSKMVELEWQNAVIKAVHGTAKIVPVKLDDCMMPPVLLQTLYVDLFGQGLEVALRQVMDVAAGRNTSAAGPQQFSNLRAYAEQTSDGVKIEVRAEHFLEPVSHFLILVENVESEVSIGIGGTGMMQSGWHEGLKLNNGQTVNAQFLGVEKATVPGFPFEVLAKAVGDSTVKLVGVLHEKRQNEWAGVPLAWKSGGA